MEEDKKTGAGGFRPGAGRKLKFKEELTQLNARIPKSMDAEMLKTGVGKTQLVREAIEFYLNNKEIFALRKAKKAWELLSQLCSGGIGDFDNDDYDICDVSPGSWSDKPPLSRNAILCIENEEKPEFPIGWDLYNPLCIVAAQRLGLEDVSAIIFGDWLATTICAGGGGHGTDGYQEPLEDAFAAATGGMLWSAAHNPDEFWERQDVRDGIAMALQKAKELTL
jgi:predicted DNA-binding protein